MPINSIWINNAKKAPAAQGDWAYRNRLAPYISQYANTGLVKRRGGWLLRRAASIWAINSQGFQGVSSMCNRSLAVSCGINCVSTTGSTARPASWRHWLIVLVLKSTRNQSRSNAWILRRGTHIDNARHTKKLTRRGPHRSHSLRATCQPFSSGQRQGAAWLSWPHTKLARKYWCWMCSIRNAGSSALPNQAPIHTLLCKVRARKADASSFPDFGSAVLALLWNLATAAYSASVTDPLAMHPYHPDRDLAQVSVAQRHAL